MNWNQLRYVLTIAEEKSITRAAQRCRIVRIGDLRKRKKRPHFVENQISKSLKELFK